MTALRKIVSSSLLAAALAATGLGASTASAFEGRGIYFGIVAGGFDESGDDAYRRPYYGTFHIDRQPVCHLGHTQWAWQEVCKPAGYAVNYCWHTQVSYRPEICN
jgi:hypothetical protein